MKDVITCDKPWGAGSKLWARDFWMGQPTILNRIVSYDEYIVILMGYLGKWNILVPRGKESECDSLSSGERRGNRTNHSSGWGLDHLYRVLENFLIVEIAGMRCHREWKPRIRNWKVSWWDPEYGETREILSEYAQTTA